MYTIRTIPYPPVAKSAVPAISVTGGIQWRRARQLADEFPTQAAMIAWREFEAVARYVSGASRNEPLGHVLKRVPIPLEDRKELNQV